MAVNSLRDSLNVCLGSGPDVQKRDDMAPRRTRSATILRPALRQRTGSERSLANAADLLQAVQVQTVMMCLLTLSTTSGRHGAMPWCRAMVRVMSRQRGGAARGRLRRAAAGRADVRGCRGRAAGSGEVRRTAVNCGELPSHGRRGPWHLAFDGAPNRRLRHLGLRK
jgi:hypothetical protein